MNKNVVIDGKTIGDESPIFIMADIGLTNGGDINRTIDLIDIAHELGVDSVKFQMIGPEDLLGDKTVEHTYPLWNGGTKTENMFSMFSKLSYNFNEWKKIKEYVESKGMVFICTAHYFGAVAILEALNASIHKICTWSVTDKPLIQEIGKTKKPMMIDTGVFDTLYLEKMLNWYYETGGTIPLILHDFHTDNHLEKNFRSIPFIKNKFNVPVGYTPSGRNTDADFMSIGLGVNILEKRLTIDNSIEENGHFKALNPTEFKDWIQRVKILESSLGEYTVKPTEKDIQDSKKYFKSLYLTDAYKEGQVIAKSHLAARRPGTGISIKDIDQIIGRKLNKNKQAETILKWEDILE